MNRTVLQGKYRLEKQLGRGGQGVVWQARHLQLGVPIAIKLMDAQFAGDGDLRARFEREARAIARLHTSHVVQVFDHGVEDETPFIAMELLEGEDLQRRLERCRRLSLLEASEIIGQAARGLECAHELGLVHRDLKPGNVFLARTDDGEIVKLLDFGIAKATRASMVGDADPTREGMLLGSPRYMSPEQARGSAQLDTRSDLWSLSVILFRAVTGERPFEGPTTIEVILAVLGGNRKRPSEIVPTLPAAVDAFFDRALAIKPEDRFQTAAELAAAFAAVASDPSPAASTPRTEVAAAIDAPLTLDGSSVSQDVATPARRRSPWLVVAALVAVLVGSSGGVLGVRRASSAAPPPIAPVASEPAIAKPIATVAAPPTAPIDPAPAASSALEAAPSSDPAAPSPSLPAERPHRASAPATAKPRKVRWGF